MLGSVTRQNVESPDAPSETAEYVRVLYGFVGQWLARARAARYRLLADWCRRHGVLHLALAHQHFPRADKDRIPHRLRRDEEPCGGGLAVLPDADRSRVAAQRGSRR